MRACSKCILQAGDAPVEQVSGATDVVWASHAPLIIAGVGLEAYASEWPQSIQSLNLKPQLVYPDARAMIREVRSGRIQAVTPAEALPVYVRELHFKRVDV